MFLCHISSKILISILSHETSLIPQAQGVRRAWVGDYDTLPQFISVAKYKQTSSAYKYNYVVNFFTWEINHIIIFISQPFGLYFARSMQTAVITDILLGDYI